MELRSTRQIAAAGLAGPNHDDIEREGALYMMRSIVPLDMPSLGSMWFQIFLFF